MDKIIFRVYSDGEVIALFPQIPSDIHGYLCQSYMHAGQHGGADPHLVVKRTRLATKREYNPLLKELKQIGYNPVVAKKFTQKDFQIRKSWS